MTTDDTRPDEKILMEQLSAWMDGELPEDEARFLQRRLDRDPALRACWERWQLASACVRGQPVRRMSPALGRRIAEAVATQSRPGRRWPWLATAAAAVLVAALVPGMLVEDPDPGVDALQVAAEAPQPSPLDATGAAPQSPASVRDFPLLVGDEPRQWPRSPLVTGDRSLEGYLVRHNALMAEDGLGGFMPYVDVVAPDAEAESASGADSSR